MTFQQALLVIKKISVFYQNFVLTEEKANDWAMVLQEYDLVSIMENLKNHVKSNKFPPTLADLLPQEDDTIKRAAYLPATAESLRISSEEAEGFLKLIEEDKPRFERIKVSSDVRKQLRELMNGIRGEE